jgi:GTP 3',8-cyclase
MIEFKPYTSIRLKLLEGCQLGCRFCHHEGNDSARVVKPDDVLTAARQIRDALGLNKVHLTGGEPTLYPYLTLLVPQLAEYGFAISITSHGLFSSAMLENFLRWTKDGIVGSINFSLHTLDPEHYLTINNLPHNSVSRREAQRSLATIIGNISAFSTHGKISVNCVVASEREALESVFEFTRQQGIALRLVPDWTSLKEAHRTIAAFLHDRRAKVEKFIIVYPTSNYAIRYGVGDTAVDVKLIQQVGITSMCKDCSFMAQCVEFFGNLRLEGNPLQVRLCIHRQGMPYVQSLAEFLQSEQCCELRERLQAKPALEGPVPLRDPFGIITNEY